MVHLQKTLPPWSDFTEPMTITWDGSQLGISFPSCKKQKFDLAYGNLQYEFPMAEQVKQRAAKVQGKMEEWSKQKEHRTPGSLYGMHRIMKVVWKKTSNFIYKHALLMLEKHYHPDVIKVAKKTRFTYIEYWAEIHRQNPLMFGDLAKNKIYLAIALNVVKKLYSDDLAPFTMRFWDHKSWWEFVDTTIPQRRWLLKLERISLRRLENLINLPQDRFDTFFYYMKDLTIDHVREAIHGFTDFAVFTVSLMTKRDLKDPQIRRTIVDGARMLEADGLTNITRAQAIARHAQSMNGQAVVDDTPFPPNPFPDLEGFTYIKNAVELQKEGYKMRHCVGGFYKSCKSGQYFVYHYEDDNGKATMGIRPVQWHDQSTVYVVDQSYGPCNQQNKTALSCVKLFNQYLMNKETSCVQ